MVQAQVNQGVSLWITSRAFALTCPVPSHASQPPFPQYFTLYCLDTLILTMEHYLLPMSSSLQPAIPADTVLGIRIRYLTDPSATIKSLSEETGIKAYKVASLLKGPQYDAFKQAFHDAQASAARDKLASYSEDAAVLWRQSMLPASMKGDHRPMKDLLIANKVIDPQASAPHVTIQVGLALDLGSALTLGDGLQLGPKGQAIGIGPLIDAAMEPAPAIPAEGAIPADPSPLPDK